MPLRLSKRAGSQFWWITGTVAGRRLRESTGTSDRALADEFRAARETSLYRAAVHGEAPRRLTFAEVLVSYLQHAAPHSDATRARLRRILDHLGPLAAADDVDQLALDAAALAILRPGVAPSTRLREIITPVRAVLTHGARRRMCAIPAFDAPAPPPSRTEWLTPAEAERLVKAAAPHLRPLLVFLITTGARLGEALALTWHDVDLQHGRALLRHTKSGRDRPVDLCPRAVAVLAGLRHRIGSVFLTNRGLPYSRPRTRQHGGAIKTAWAHAIAAAGIHKAATPHTCRHSWASWRYATHKDLLRLKSEGGWASVAMVERYAHLTPAGMVDAIARWRGERPIGTKSTQAAPLNRHKRLMSKA